MRFLPLWLCAATFLHAQTPATSAPATSVAPVPSLPLSVPVSSLPASGPAGETALTLDVQNGIRAVQPSRVTVPVGEYLKIQALAMGSTVAWQRNGQPLTVTSNPLILPSVTSDDTGIYSASTNSLTSQALVLGVGPTTRLLNLSSRGWVQGGSQPFTTGFVVATNNGSTYKKTIIRAIGPSLVDFGITDYVPRPTIKILDAAGKEYTNSFAYVTVAGGLTYETDLADSLAKCGAFPVPTGADANDVTRLMPFRAGSYTIQVGSADGTAGTVLLEIYEVP